MIPPNDNQDPQDQSETPQDQTYDNKIEIDDTQFPDAQIGDVVKVPVEGVIEEDDDGGRCVRITKLDGQDIGGGNEDQNALDSVTKAMRLKLQEKSDEMNSYKGIPQDE